MPHVSVIVPAFNNRQTIGLCLKAIRDSHFKDYELIVVDDGSQDGTSLIAKEYADKVIIFDKHQGRNYARQSGVQSAAGEIIVNIDSDVLIQPDTLSKINDFFSRHQETDALTGLLSKKHSNKNFFSLYKNFYMHYIFEKLPEKVTFLYGSIYALRRACAVLSNLDSEKGEDTELGQTLFSSGREIAFLKDLEVVHLKKYSFFSFIKNDFLIPFSWALIFIKNKGWRQLFRNKTGFAHSPKEQILSVVLAPVCVVLSFVGLFQQNLLWPCLNLYLAWIILNSGFIYFLVKEKNLLFGGLAFFVTFFDHLVMAAGIVCGLGSALTKKRVFSKV
ncbi:MAG TPA: glycosyltransferase family 2 protein [Candidatus Omnitrophota bacterium]|nr:glycosyltransferase family 2 protein [Candidatus Omnitrophota bacterium]